MTLDIDVVAEVENSTPRIALCHSWEVAVLPAEVRCKIPSVEVAVAIFPKAD